MSGAVDLDWGVAAVFSLAWTLTLGLGLLDAGCRTARRFGIASPPSLRLLAGIVIAASALWLWMLLLAAIGGLGPRSTAVGIVGAFAALRALDPAPGAIPTARIAALLVGRSRRLRGARLAASWLAAVVVLLAQQGLARPAFEYDALSYHLPFTARVLDTGTIPHLDTPFGDPAAAYQPKTEHVLRTLLAPIPGHERLVWIGAFPHLPLLWLAIYVAARALGATRPAALWGAAGAMLATVTLSQAVDALVDLPVASWWMAFAALALSWQRPAVREDPTRDRALATAAGLSLGLAFGAKYLAVALAPLLLLIVGPALGARRSPRAWAALAAGVLATGSFFYLRAAWWTGNPAYPVALELFGIPLLEGPLSRDAMTSWVFALSRAEHVALGPRLASFLAPLVGNAHIQRFPGWVELTPWLCVAPALLWLAGSARMLTRPARRAAPAAARIGLALLAPAALCLAWAVVPFTYGRFAILAVAAIGTVAAAGAGRALPIAAMVIGGVVLEQALVGDRWTRIGVDALALASVAWAWNTWLPQRALRTHAVAGFAGAAVGLLLATAALTRPEITATAPGAWRAGLAVVDAMPRDARVAYAGNNVPYVLRGNAGRRVVHVPLDGDREARFDTRAAAWQAANDAEIVSASPGLDRSVQDASRWLAGLRTARVDRLVVTRLGGTQLVQVRHDADGFPVEDGWARAAAPALVALHSDAAIRIYAVDPSADPERPLPPRRERREPDAFALLPHPGALARHYPLAAAELASPRYDLALRRARALLGRERVGGRQRLRK